MIEERSLRPRQAAIELTTWYDETLWLPFVEDEDANITGPGHQDKAAFAAMVNHYDAHASGEPQYSTWTADDISHTWMEVYESWDGEVFYAPTFENDPFRVAVTTLWGVR